MIGPNSATKIVQATNTGLAIWHLGMGNIAHPIMNVLTFVSNVTPEIAMIIGATTRDLGGYYSHFLAVELEVLWVQVRCCLQGRCYTKASGRWLIL